MATIVHLQSSHKGEDLLIDLLAKDRDGSTLSSPASQTITLAIGRNPSAAPLLELTAGWTLADAGTATFEGTFTETMLSSLDEGALYYYNIWSRLGTSSPLLQAKGQFKRLPAIELT